MVAIASPPRDTALAPDRQVLSRHVPARRRGRRYVGILVEGGKGHVGRVLITIDVERVGQPPARYAPVLEQREIFTALFQCGLEERGDVRLRDAPLFLAWQQWCEVQEPAQRRFGIRAPP